jgi:predicted HicB family RNase H-like nuclease
MSDVKMVTVRMHPSFRVDVKNAATREGVSVQEFCYSAIAREVEKSEELQKVKTK